jgi:hypothetical protein
MVDNYETHIVYCGLWCYGTCCLAITCSHAHSAFSPHSPFLFAYPTFRDIYRVPVTARRECLVRLCDHHGAPESGQLW